MLHIYPSDNRAVLQEARLPYPESEPLPQTLPRQSILNTGLMCLFFFIEVQTKMSWRILLTRRYSRQRLGIKVQGCPVLR